LIFVTNHPNRILETISDRCDQKIKYPLPDKETRQNIIEYYINEKIESKQINGLDYVNNINLRDAAKKTWSYSIRQIKQLIKAAERDCISDANDKRIFTNERFKKFYGTIRDKNNRTSTESFIDRLHRYDERFNFSRSIVGNFFGGLAGGVSNILVTEGYNHFVRFPRLREKERLATELFNCSIWNTKR